ncbi:MAG: DUF2130 domain-containing protein, partial [Erysipelotrichia bacterium]|nr:DUF2130 domain-containing protein [Erysipelotrichia bacterium]
MNEIKCPHCGKLFTIDKESYADILNQIRTKEFNQEIHEKLEQAKVQYTSEMKLKEEKAKNAYREELSQKENEIIQLKGQIHNFHEQKVLVENNIRAEMEKEIAEREKRIIELSSNLKTIESEKQLAIKQVESQKQQELERLSSTIKIQEAKIENEKNSIKEKYEMELKQKDEVIAFYKDFRA